MSSVRSRPSLGARFLAGVPFLCVLAAILLLAGSAITWVTSPNWGKREAVAPSRNVGIVPDHDSVPVSASILISPVQIEIPKLNAKAPVIKVATMPGGELDVPQDPRVVGWWSAGAKPGAAKGTAILAGHINYAGVQGVLAHIGTLNPGDLVYITGMSNGKQTRMTFKITGVRSYIKQTLPYKQIFDQNSIGRLALVTCGGPFDARTGNYLDNIVAFAVPA